MMIKRLLPHFSTKIKLLSVCVILVLLSMFFVHRETSLEADDDQVSDTRYDNIVEDKMEIMTTPFYRYIGKPCKPNHRRKVFRYLLQYWKKFSKRYRIPYVLAFGSLLGQYRNKEVIPWDGDIDVMVNSSSYRRLKVLSNKRNFKQGADNKFRLVVQPEFESRAEDDRRRWNCEGKEIPKQVDSCSFTQPLGRLIYRYYHLDIFHWYGAEQLFHVAGETKPLNRTDLYPFVRCTFMNVLTWCPTNRKKFLENEYGNIEPQYMCKDGQWVSVNDSE